MKIAPMHIARMTRRLADLTAGGLTLNRSLEIMSQQRNEPPLQPLLIHLREDIQSGKSFSQAIRSQNGLFTPVYAGLVRAGESSGQLETTLDELARLLESEIETKQRIKAALAYPIILLSLAVFVCVFLTVVVVPRFESLFQDLGQRLPWPTLLLINITAFLKTAGWTLPFVATLGFVALRKKKKRAKAAVVKHLTRMRWVKEFYLGIFIERWSHVMTSLLHSGFTIIDALKLSKHAVGNFGPASHIDAVLTDILSGKSFAHALSASPVFPPFLSELVGVGEESGRLEQTFARLTQTYRRENELRLKLALTLLEPALIVGMGLIVGFVAVAMLLPIFEISGNLR